MEKSGLATFVTVSPESSPWSSPVSTVQVSNMGSLFCHMILMADEITT